MKHLLATTAAAAMLFWAAQPAQALVCISTEVLGQAGTSDLAGLSGGNCVQVSDKIFGDASVSGAITGQAGNAIFTFTDNSVTIGFQGAVPPDSSGTINYTVAIADGFNSVIVAVEQDFNITSVGTGIVGTATLDGTANGTAFSCSRTTAGVSDCPSSLSLAGVSEVLMSQVVTTDINSTVTGIQNTFVQAVPEPGTLGLLGSMLLGMGWLIRRRRNQS
jgi:hypothetical protein